MQGSTFLVPPSQRNRILPGTYLRFILAISLGTIGNAVYLMLVFLVLQFPVLPLSALSLNIMVQQATSNDEKSH